MTNEKRYQFACEMLRAYDAISDGAMNAAEEVIANPHKWENAVFFPFYAAAAEMLIEARQGMDKNTTAAGTLSALKRIYKSCAASHRESLRGFFPSGDRWALCDGYRFIRLNSKPESIPDAPPAPEYFNLDGCIPADARDAEPVELPTAAEIKAHIADRKAKHGKKWRTNSDAAIQALPGWWCNPEYLLDMIQALPGGVAYKPGGPFKPLYIESPDGDALLLPVRHVEPVEQRAEDAA